MISTNKLFHYINAHFFIVLRSYLLWMTSPLWLKLYFMTWPGTRKQIVNVAIYHRIIEIISHVVFGWPISPFKNCLLCTSSRNITEVVKQQNCPFQNFQSKSVVVHHFIMVNVWFRADTGFQMAKCLISANSEFLSNS